MCNLVRAKELKKARKKTLNNCIFIVSLAILSKHVERVMFNIINRSKSSRSFKLETRSKQRRKKFYRKISKPF